MTQKTDATFGTRGGIAACWLGGLLLAVPILVVRYPPMGDLAMHEALVSILRHRGDPGWAPPGLYTVVAPQANQLFPWLAYVLSFAFRTDTACKLVVALSVLLAPPAAGRLLVQLRASPWLGLLAGPVACGWMFRWGLVANLTGFVALLAALPSVDRLALRPSWRAAAICTLASVGVFFAHESAAVVLAIVVALFALVRGRDPRRLFVRVVPALAVAALVAIQWKVSARLVGASMRSVGDYHGIGTGARLLGLPGAVFGGLGPPRLALVGASWVGALVASVAARRAGRPAPLRVAIWRGRYALLAALFVLLFLTFPMGVGGTTLVAYRFIPAACVCLVAACAGRTVSMPVIALSIAAPVAMLAAELRDFKKAETTYRALDAIIAQLPTGAAVAQLDLTPRPAGHVAPVPGAAGRVLAERGGRMLFAMTDMPPNPVYVPASMQWNEPITRLAQAAFAFAPTSDFTRFGYLLVREESPRMRPLVAMALAPEAQQVVVEGEWMLFKSHLPTVPLTAPDGPGPGSAETLGERLQKLLEDSSTPPAP